MLRPDFQTHSRADSVRLEPTGTSPDVGHVGQTVLSFLGHIPAPGVATGMRHPSNVGQTDNGVKIVS